LRMTVNGHMPLKMLEPAIRPGMPAGPASQGNKPIEQQSFESLLAGKLATTSSVEPEQQQEDQSLQVSAKTSASQSPLGQLARIDQIENNSLRSLMGRQGQIQQDTHENAVSQQQG